MKKLISYLIIILILIITVLSLFHFLTDEYSKRYIISQCIDHETRRNYFENRIFTNSQYVKKSQNLATINSIRAEETALDCPSILKGDKNEH